MGRYKIQISAIFAVLLVACSLDGGGRADIGLSEAGPGLNAVQNVPDLGRFIAPDAANIVDAAVAEDVQSIDLDASPILDVDQVSVDVGAQADAQVVTGDSGVMVGDADPIINDTGGLDAGAADAGVTGARLFGSVSDIITRRGLQGVEVCVQNRQPEFPCSTTGGGGQYALDAPAGEDIVFIYSGGGILPTVVHLQLPLGPTRFNVQVLSQVMVPGLANGFGQQIDATKGYVSFTSGMAGNRGLAGVTGSIAPGSGAGPFYLGANGLPDPQAVQTTSSGTGTFINVNPGMVNVSVTPPNTHICPPYGLAVTQGNAWRLPVVAGHLSIAVFECSAR